MSTPHKSATRSAVLIVIIATVLTPSPPARAQAGGETSVAVAKAGAFAQQFVQNFASLRYEEDIVEQKLKNNGKVAYQRQEKFDSIVRLHFDDTGLKVEEQRIQLQSPSRRERRPLLTTSGFSVLAAVFHPYYAASFRFTEAQQTLQDASSAVEIHFVYLPGTPSPALYQMVGLERPLPLSGTAWIDPTTGKLLRIEALATAGLSDVGIKSIRADVSFGPVSLRDENQPEWLPISAIIDLETPHQHWRNIHHFVDYRKYRVTTNFPEVFKP